MSRCKEAIMGVISSFLPFSCFALKNQCVKGSSEVDKWSEMLPEILEDISDRLPLRDFFVFRGVCRKWRSAPSDRSEIPWLMFYDFDRKSSGVAGDTCYLYNRPHPNCCAVRLPHLRGAMIMHSKAGWLFARRHNGQFFLYHPLTLTKIDLPTLTKMDLPKHVVTKEQVCTMTIPTSHDPTVFVLSRRINSVLEISSYRVGDTEWKNHAAKISKGRFGTMVAAYACDCADRHKPEECAVQMEKTIYIYGSKRSLVYDYMNKRRVKEWTAKSRAKASKRVRGGKLMLWDKDLDSRVHQKNWLERFGEKGISISTCSLRRVSGRRRGVAGESRLTVEYKSVRTSWIEPRFG